jgi:hypothetical protein
MKLRDFINELEAKITSGECTDDTPVLAHLSDEGYWGEGDEMFEDISYNTNEVYYDKKDGYYYEIKRKNREKIQILTI